MHYSPQHSQQLWIEPVGNIIVARVRGIPSESMLRECQERIITLLKDTGQGNILYDCLELEAPNVEVTFEQWKLDAQIGAGVRLRRAIVVPNTKLAYMARIAFANGEHRVFYSDLIGAVTWLNEGARGMMDL